MKKNVLNLILLFCVGFIAQPANAQSRDARIVAYARKIQAASLEPGLPRQPLEAWLKSIVGPKATLTWEVNDCGEQTGVAGDGSSFNPPMCAELQAELIDGREVGILIGVGTYKTGIKGKASIFYVYVKDHGSLIYFSRLRDLPVSLRRGSGGYITPVRDPGEGL
ncbi:MAG: hypothetical protein ABJC05_05665 [Pyrinomonadaceae bacterium]